MRIPLAGKVAVAFVAVIAAGAVPVHWSLRRDLHQAVRDHVAADVLRRTTRLADQLHGRPLREAVQALESASAVMPERVSLVGMDGEVLFDSGLRRGLPTPTLMDGPEIQLALSQLPGVSEHVGPDGHEEFIDAAVAWRDPAGIRGAVRLSSPLTEELQITTAAVSLVERGTAVSISLALLLSFVAVIAIIRPLRRMRDAAIALAQGELTVHPDVNTRDELEELARALEQVGTQLRTRLAHAGGGEALLGQFVHAMVQGVVVIGPDRKVHHVNGVARAQLGLRGPQESERMSRLLSSDAVQSAMREAVNDPLGVDMRVPHPVTGELLDGTVVALRRLDGEPLQALILDVLTGTETALPAVPDAADVVALPLRELMDRAMRRVQEDLDESNATFKLPDEWPATQVADVGGRVESAVTDTLRAAVRAPGAQLSTPLSASIQNGCVVVRLPAALSADVIKRLEPRLAPLGGRLQSAQGSVELWLPRA